MLEEVQRLLVACDTERDEAVVLFLLDIGVRASAFVHLSGQDIDPATGTVMVRQGKGRKDLSSI